MIGKSFFSKNIYSDIVSKIPLNLQVPKIMFDLKNTSKKTLMNIGKKSFSTHFITTPIGKI